MARPKIRVIGELLSAEDGGLFFHVSLDGYGDPLAKPLQNYHKGAAPTHVFWVEALPDAYSWGGKLPSKREWKGPTRREDEPLDQWRAARDAQEAQYAAEYAQTEAAYYERLHSDERYKKAATELLREQRVEPQILFGSRARRITENTNTCWLYREKVVRVEAPEVEFPFEKIPTLIKHRLLREERNYEKIQREVEALENVEKLQGVSREPIPGSVRLFVWQRDKGQCVKCGSRERLEFDHIIPVVEGGSSTERNVQLLCEACNRSKGAAI
jgi:5-methylcytosine-specific restriction endonuclease McrA